MNSKKDYSIEIGGKTLILEISSLAEQTNAAVLGKYGETVVLATVVMGEKDTSLDYLPLKVDYEERFYAAGKIIGSRFIRREGRPSDEAILAGRLVDRTIRPLFDQGIRREIQIVVTVVAYDEENEPEFVGLLAASLALGISDIPWKGPVGGGRIAKIGQKFVVNPSNSEMSKPDFVFEAFVAGPANKINMIEFSGQEALEKDIGETFKVAQEEINKLADFQNSIIQKIGRSKTEVPLYRISPDLRRLGEHFLSSRLEDALYQSNKLEYKIEVAKLKKDYYEHLRQNTEVFDSQAADLLWEELIDETVHKNILEKERRPDGRALDEIRTLKAETRLFERTHGSALFVRGNTQALAVTTLAPPGAEQLVETMEMSGKRRFMLHYNFPPYSVGEIGTFRGPGRREIGHGALAEKAIRLLLPSREEFPYTIRVVSEVLSSNGSSSMATVCASSLSLMDAGVPIRKAAAGIAMGLIAGKSGGKEAVEYKILTDIQGPEDHYGDMDFKVAGTISGVTAIQLDTKIDGLSLGIIEKALEQARKARLQILGFMGTILDKPKPKISPYAPAILQLKIKPEKIGSLIGPGGKVINGLIKSFGLTSIDVEEDGSVFVSADSTEKTEKAIQEIKSFMRDFEVGEIIDGTVVKILDFGAIVDLGGGQDGMIHVSELKNGFVKKVEDVLKVGDLVRAKVIRVDPDGKIGLSLKQL